MLEVSRPVCACHGLPMWRKDRNAFRCRVSAAARKRPVSQAARDRAARKRARESFFHPERGLKRAQRAAADRYVALMELSRAARGVSTSALPIDQGPDRPPLCACHHEPMLSDGAGGWRCGPLRREQERRQEQALKVSDYERYREKCRRSERRRRAAARGVRSEAYSRQELFDRDAGLCRYCGRQAGADWHIAHLVALARGGEDTLDNVAVSCATCNIADGVGRLSVQLHLPTAA